MAIKSWIGAKSFRLRVVSHNLWHQQLFICSKYTQNTRKNENEFKLCSESRQKCTSHVVWWARVNMSFPCKKQPSDNDWLKMISMFTSKLILSIIFIFIFVITATIALALFSFSISRNETITYTLFDIFHYSFDLFVYISCIVTSKANFEISPNQFYNVTEFKWWLDDANVAIPFVYFIF